MARKPILEGGKRDELISAALKLFLENGYENTSIRMILHEVNGEVGMFYHYFKSKNEIFESAVTLYFKQYSERFKSIVIKSELPLSGLIDEIFSLFKNTSDAYTFMNRNSVLHWTIELALREQTLNELEPYITIILQNAIERKYIQQPDVACNDLAAFFVHGIAGIIHQEHEITSELFYEKKKAIIKLISNTLQISPEMIGGKNL